MAFGLGATPFTRPTPVLATAGPIAHWTFDEGSGTTVGDSAGTHNGSFIGTPTWVTSGAMVGSGALSFAGAGNGVLVPDDIGLEPSAVSIAAWIRSPAAADDRRQTIVQKGATGCEAGSWSIEANGNGALGSVGGLTDALGPNTWFGWTSDGARVFDNAWHHVVFSSSGPGAVIGVYVDGVSWTGTGGPLMYGLPTTDALYIGAQPAAGCSTRTEFGGQIDDLQIYDRVLSAAEVLAFLPAATATTMTLDTGPSPVELGTYTDMTAVLSPPPSTTGIVRLFDVTGGAHDAVALNGYDLVDGTAYFRITPAALGQRTYVAEYEGSPRYGASTSSPGTLQVVRSPRTVTLQADDKTLYPTQPVTLTARASDWTDGLVTFRDTEPGGAVVVLGTGYVSWDGATYSTSVTVPQLSVGDHSIRARLSQTPTISGADSNVIVVHVTKRAPYVSMAVSGTPQANNPQRATISIGAPGLDNPPVPTGTVTVKDGATVVQTVPADDWTIYANLGGFAAGSHSFTATYSGDAFYASYTSPPFVLVLGPDVVAASSAGPEYATFYPVKDGYRDAVHVTGQRDETVSVGIRIYSPAGVKVAYGSIGRGTGAYSYPWNGRNASGAVLPAGQYKIVQSLKDGTGHELVLTSFVTLSPKRLVDHTTYVTKVGSAISSKGTTGTGSATTSGGYVKVSAGSDGWAGVGWQFTLPAAAMYRSLGFEIQAKSPFAVPPAWIGLQNFTLCPLGPGDWDVTCFDHTSAVGDAGGALKWYSTAGSATENRSDRTVRGLISQSFGTSWVYAARVKVTYAVLE